MTVYSAGGATPTSQTAPDDYPAGWTWPGPPWPPGWPKTPVYVAALTSGGPYYSTDGGITWAAATGVTGANYGLRIGAKFLAFKSVSASDIVQVYTSTDYGATYVLTTTIPSNLGSFGLYPTVANNGRILIGTVNPDVIESGRVAYSDNQGVTWTIGADLNTVSCGAQPIWLGGNTCACFSGINGVRVAMHMSYNNGATWGADIGVPDGLTSGFYYIAPLGAGVWAAAGLSSGKLWTTLGGAGTWTLRDNPGGTASGVCGGRFAAAVRKTSTGARCTEDNGATWQAATGITGTVNFIQTAYGNWYVSAGTTGKIYHSEDADLPAFTELATVNASVTVYDVAIF